MSDSIDNDIFDIMARHAQLEGVKVAPATKLQNIGLDSLKMVEIIFDLEERFDISIPDPEIGAQNKQFETAADVVQIVKDLIQQQGKTP